MTRLVWTLPDGESTARWAPDESGGSQTVRFEDLGTFNAVDYLAGPGALYTPAATEYLLSIISTETVPTDAGRMYAFVDLNPDTETKAGNIVKVLDSVESVLEGDLVTSAPCPPVTIGLGYGGGAAAPWQANHAYVIGNFQQATVFGAGHIWETFSDGTSDGTPPDFAGNIGGSVVDNDITWQDQGAAPSEGSCRIGLLIATVPA